LTFTSALKDSPHLPRKKKTQEWKVLPLNIQNSLAKVYGKRMGKAAGTRVTLNYYSYLNSYLNSLLQGLNRLNRTVISKTYILSFPRIRKVGRDFPFGLLFVIYVRPIKHEKCKKSEGRRE
jgi:hypothetical protein